MTETRKSRPGAPTPERQTENGTASQTAHASITDSTISAGGRQPLRIADFLSPGQQNARPLRYLKELTDMDNRTIRRQIERERRAGALIVSDNKHGYYLTDDPAEVQRFTRSMLHRSAEIAKTARILEKVAGLD